MGFILLVFRKTLIRYLESRILDVVKGTDVSG